MQTISGKLKLLYNKIKARVMSGEVLDDVIASYSYLTAEEIEIIKQEVMG